MTAQDVEIVVFDEDMDPVGRIRNAESFRFVRNWYTPHTFELRIDAAKLSLYELLTALQTKGHIGFTDDEGEFRVCIVENIVKPTGAAQEQYIITGRGVLALLERRKLMAGYSDGTGFDAVTDTPYETAMRHYVDANCITALGPDGASDASRVIAGLSLAAVDAEQGGTCEFQGRGQGLLDVLCEFSRSCGLACDLAWVGAGELPTERYLFEFRVSAGTDESADVILSMDLGNVLGYEYQESVLGYRNLIYVAATGDAASRALSPVHAGSEPTGRDRFEDYIDASDCATADQITQRGAETLAAKAGTESLEFTFNPASQSAVYGVDFVCGDTVTVIDPGVATLVDRITSVTTTYDEKGKTITLGMGTSAPDLVSILKMDRKQNTGVRR